MELKPCPFCGNEPTVMQAKEGVFFVFCEADELDYVQGFCKSICLVEPSMSVAYKTMDEAISAWNTRAEPRWIPVTERLPEIPDNSEWEDRFVLCTFENPDGRRYVLETHYLDGEFSVGDEISIDFTPPNYIGQMYEGKDTKLVAWMYKPLPQPPAIQEEK